MKAAYAGFEGRREHGRARSPERGNRESPGRLEAPGDHRPASLNGRDDRDGRAKRTEVAASQPILYLFFVKKCRGRSSDPRARRRAG
jgi:hypothetical protein